MLSRILPRPLWNALAAKYAYDLPVYPVPVVYIHHGATHAPLDLRDADGDGAPDNEESIWRGYQRFHMTNRGWSDIAYNFGVGLSGQVYEGRGWRRQGGATGSPDDRSSLAICAIGNFEEQIPSEDMITAIVGWIVTGIELGHILPNVSIRGHRDKPYGTSCPGKNLYAFLPEIRSRVADRRVSTVQEDETVEGPIEDWYKHIAAAPDGTKDEAMRLWQWQLSEWGFLDKQAVDGVKGPFSRAANKQFEQAHIDGPSNGVPGNAAWQKLLAGPPKDDGLRAQVEELSARIADAVKVLAPGTS